MNRHRDPELWSKVKEMAVDKVSRSLWSRVEIVYKEFLYMVKGYYNKIIHLSKFTYLINRMKGSLKLTLDRWLASNPPMELASTFLLVMEVGLGYTLSKLF